MRQSGVQHRIHLASRVQPFQEGTQLALEPACGRRLKVETAIGPHISDPRTGEILNADLQFFHNVMNLQRNWYFLQVGPLDLRAQKLPLPDELMGRLIEFVCAH